MITAPEVTCIIPITSSSEYLTDAINSILNQTYRNWELIIIHGPANKPISHFSNILQKSNNIHIVEESNSNLLVLCSKAVSKSQGKYIAFLDPDDVWIPKKIEQQVKILESEPEAAMVYGRDILWYSWSSQLFNNLDYSCELGIVSEKLFSPPQLLNILVKNQYQTATLSNALIRKTVLIKYIYEKLNFSKKYQVQSLYSKILLNESTYVSSSCFSKTRCFHDDSKVFTEEVDSVSERKNFLLWLQNYIHSFSDKYSEFDNTIKDELDLFSTEEIKHIIESIIPDIKISKISYLGKGVNNRTYRVNEDFIYRFPIHFKAIRSLAIEEKVLMYLKDYLPFCIPDILFINNRPLLKHSFFWDRIKSKLPGILKSSNDAKIITNESVFSIYKEIRGSLLYPEFVKSDLNVQKKLARDIAEFLKSLHSLPIKPFKKMKVKERKFNYLFYKNSYKIFDKNLSGYFNENDNIVISKLLTGGLFTYEYTPSLLHGDLHWDHFIFNENTCTISGVIDFGSVIIGDPLYDFIGIWQQYPEEFLINILQNYYQREVRLEINKIIALYCCDIIRTAYLELKNNKNTIPDLHIHKLKAALNKIIVFNE